MAAGTTPIFIATPKTWYGQVTVANTGRDGSGTIVTLVTGAANGSAVQAINLWAAATSAANVVRIFLSLDGGTTKRLIYEFEITAVTVSGSVAGFNAEWIPSLPINLPDANAILYASVHTTGETINLRLTGGDY